jgi:hypothetical protein
MTYIRIDEDGKRGPTHATATCPTCKKDLDVIIPADRRTIEQACDCGAMLSVGVPE